jgi:regulator of RNase E activity RraB
MELKHIPATIDINSRNEQRIAGIVNINDKKTRYLDVTIIASGEKLDISGCTVTAIFVIDDVLVNNAVDCTVTNNIVTIPLENFNCRYGYLSIELNIVKDGTVIVNTPIPLKIQVTSSIADSAKISEKTYGTIAETVKEVYDARGTYENLSNRLAGIDNEITELDESVSLKVNLKADKATTLEGYGIEDAYTKTYVSKALSYKLDKRPFDTEPKYNSPNYITSGTVYNLSLIHI